MRLEQSHRYRCPLHLGAFESFASNERIVKVLTDAGFVDVEVVGSGYDRFARATWPLVDQDVDIPPEIHEDEVEDITTWFEVPAP